jgi:hypothetical protein
MYIGGMAEQGTTNKKSTPKWIGVAACALVTALGLIALGFLIGEGVTAGHTSSYVAAQQWSRGGMTNPTYGDLVDAGDVSFIVTKAQGLVKGDNGDRHQFVTVTVQIQNLTGSPITWNAADRAILTDTDGKTYTAQGHEVELPAQAASKELLNFVLPPNALPSHVDLQGTTGKTKTVSLNG